MTQGDGSHYQYISHTTYDFFSPLNKYVKCLRRKIYKLLNEKVTQENSNETEVIGDKTHYVWVEGPRVYFFEHVFEVSKVLGNTSPGVK